MLRDPQAIYQMINQQRRLEERFRDGNNGDLTLHQPGWIHKQDKVGVAFCAHEFRSLQKLQDSGLVPIVDEEEGILGYPDGFLMEQIGEGATLQEYAEAVILGQVDPKSLVDLFEKVGKLVNQFWAMGWIHNDLHLRNIVIGWPEETWQPYIIDLATSYHQDFEAEFAERFLLIAEELPGLEGEWDYFWGCLGSPMMGIEPPREYTALLRCLENEIDVV